VLGDLVLQPVRLPAVSEIGAAGLRGDGETGGHGQTKVGHFREVGTFATKQVFEILVAFGEVVDVLGHDSSSRDRMAFHRPAHGTLPIPNHMKRHWLAHTTFNQVDTQVAV